jgi:acyl-CoA thioesterase I
MHFHERAEIGKMQALLFGFALAAAMLLAQPGVAVARTIHIVAFGDSATYGWLVKRNEDYPAQLQAVLRKKGYDVTVTNAGVPGDTTARALRRFDSAIGPDTDIALVELGTNDLNAHVPQQRMRANLRTIVRALQKRGIGVLLIGLGSLDLADVARAEHVAYAQWILPPGRHRARDRAHYNAQGYAIVIARMLPQVEALIAQSHRR